MSHRIGIVPFWRSYDRQTVLRTARLAEELGYEVIAKRLTRDDIYIADEAFFTGTAAEVTPIRELDGRIIGAGKAGPITKAIQKAFFDVVTGKDKKRHKWLTRVK